MPITRRSSFTEEQRRFLQDRIARFGRLVFTVTLAMMLVVPLMKLLGGAGASTMIERVEVWPGVFQAVACVSFGVMWIVARRGDHSPRFLRGLETTCVVVGGLSVIGMGVFIPLPARPELIVAASLILVLFTRAVYVPSGARYALVLHGLLAVPVLLLSFLRYSHADVSDYTVLAHASDPMSPNQVASMFTVATAAWWGFGTALAVGTTHVIHDLRETVQDIRRLGQYTLERKLGQGGMGMVYRAKHAMLARPTAIKLLPPDMVGEQSLARFEREVQLTAQLTHPNTVTVFDYGHTPDGIFYYAMELIDGGSLADVVDLDGPQPIGRMLHILSQAAGALSEAHDIGLIHRDIKPANIMLCSQGGSPDVVKVVDFGLVKQMTGSVGVSLSGADTLQGTPQYISPEAIRSAKSIDGRSDIYALGGVAYFLVTGQHVFEGNSVVEVCGHHLHSQPVPLGERLGADVPEAIEALVLECLAKDPADRPQSAAELVSRIEALRVEHPWGKLEGRAWWAANGDALRAKSGTEGESTSGKTIAVDLGHRASA